MNIAYSLAAYPAGALADRVNKLVVLGAGFAMLIAANLLLAIDGSAIALGAGVLLWGLHMGFTQGLFASLVADTAPAELRGTAFGVFNMLGGVALLLASFGAGLLWDRVGPPATFLAGAAVTVVCLGGLLVMRRRLPQLGAVVRAA